LRSLDPVAFVRFASVYRDFREARDFNALVDELVGEAKDAEESPAARRAGEEKPNPGKAS
jgi:transcriptional repressor NrdR